MLWFYFFALLKNNAVMLPKNIELTIVDIALQKILSIPKLEYISVRGIDVR